MVPRVHAWQPDVPGLREVYHARFDHAYPMHTHENWAVMLVDDGAVAYGLDREIHHAVPATLTLLPPGVPHDGRPAVAGSDYRKRVLYLDPEWLPFLAQSLATRRPTLDPSAARLANRVHAALAEPGDLMAAEHWLLALRESILRHLGHSARVPRDKPLARRLREMLDARTTESFTIASAAAHLGTHPSHLVRVFSQTYGLAPHQYVIGRRIDLARRLLVDGYRPAEAAVLAGFHDQSHLTRHFRRVLGVTPAMLVAKPPAP
jgi:AraC-like DNA-binding protein